MKRFSNGTAELYNKANISTDAKRRAGLSAIAEPLVNK